MTRRGNYNVRCTRCQMHPWFCICDEIPHIPTRTTLCMVVHRLEDRKPTNTGRLAAHCLPHSQWLVHGHEGQVPACPPLLGKQPLLLFPAAGVQPLGPQHAVGDPVMLFVPDGTWRQASKMARRIPWLAQVPRVGLPPGPPTAYRLRSESRQGGLATMEAIARAMGILEGPAVQQAMERVFQLMVERTLQSRGTALAG